MTDCTARSGKYIKLYSRTLALDKYILHLLIICFYVQLVLTTQILMLIVALELHAKIPHNVQINVQSRDKSTGRISAVAFSIAFTIDFNQLFGHWAH